MRIRHNQWPEAIGKRIGTGTVNYTTSNVGQTLHIPCEHGGGHIVDITIPPKSHPDHIAKMMLNKGWTIGRKLVCPDHQRKKKAAPAKPESTKKEITKVTEQAVAVVAEKSPAAKQAFRFLMMTLEDYYETERQGYKDGQTDAIIAKKLGISEKTVAATRAEYFGPLGIPPELAALADELTALRKNAIDLIDDTNKRIELIERRFESICNKNGWLV